MIGFGPRKWDRRAVGKQGSGVATSLTTARRRAAGTPGQNPPVVQALFTTAGEVVADAASARISVQLLIVTRGGQPRVEP